jgi:hypothetical protein
MDGVPPQIGMVVPNQPDNRHMSERTRNDVFSMLLEVPENGVLLNCAITRVANDFVIQRSRVSRLCNKLYA